MRFGKLVELPAGADKDTFRIQFIGVNLVAADGKNAWALKDDKWEKLEITFKEDNEIIF